jgi:putative transposase
MAGGDPTTVLERDGLIDSLTKALAERALSAEADHHLCGDDYDENRRNGYGRKTVLTGDARIGACFA